jgi:AraC family transcriptional regulator, dual regulator of chb operon
MPDRLLLKNFVPEGSHCHFGRGHFRHVERLQPHSHDFLEVFWIEEGVGEQEIDGERQPLTVGTLVLVHADDEHAFTARPGRTCRLANIAFAASIWSHVHQRYFSDRADLFAQSAPRRFELTTDRLRALQQFAAEIVEGGRSLAAIERFLLNLAHLVGAPRAAAAAPDWLVSAIDRLAEPRHFTEGPRALMTLAGRSAEHVAREARRCYARTPTDLVNSARMAWAARRLAESDDDIFAVCLACGLSNLGHFYRLFRAAHGVTPLRYRQSHRRIVGGSG